MQNRPHSSTVPRGDLARNIRCPPMSRMKVRGCMRGRICYVKEVRSSSPCNQTESLKEVNFDGQQPDLKKGIPQPQSSHNNGSHTNWDIFSTNFTEKTKFYLQHNLPNAILDLYGPCVTWVLLGRMKRKSHFGTGEMAMSGLPSKISISAQKSKGPTSYLGES
jgi:hypothetical protein